MYGLWEITLWHPLDSASTLDSGTFKDRAGNLGLVTGGSRGQGSRGTCEKPVNP